MLISSDTLVETPSQVRQLIQVAAANIHEDPAPVVAALAYGVSFPDRQERLQLATDLLQLSQLSGSDLRVLATTIGFDHSPDADVTAFLDALLDHHAICSDVVIALFHTHIDDLPDYCPALMNPGDLAVTVGQATAKRNVVRSKSAARFVDYVSSNAPPGVCQQVAHLLSNAGWEASLWSAYQTASVLQDCDPDTATPLESDWCESLEPALTYS